MKHIKLVLVGMLLLIGLFLLASDVQHLRSCCGGAPPPQPPPPPPPPPPQPPKPPTETPPSPEPPKPPSPEPPKPPTPEPPTPEPPKPEPPTPEPPKPPTPEPPKPPDNPPPTPGTPPPLTPPLSQEPTAPTGPQAPATSTPGLTVKSPVSQSAPRPSLSGGLMPLIRSLKAGTSSLLGVVEPWEVWWTRNRDNYLSFRQSIEWVKIVNDSGSTSITVYPGYEEALKVLGQAVSDRNHHIAMRAAISLGKTIDPKNPISVKVSEILKKANETETRYFVKNNILLGSSLSGDNSQVDLMKKVAQDKTTPPLRRCYAIMAMGNLTNDPELLKIMRKILTDQDDPEVKSCACLSLGNLKDVSAVPMLGKLLNGSDGRKEHQLLRGYAALGLGRIGTEEALNELKKSTPATERDTEVLSAVVIALGLTGSPDSSFWKTRKDSILPFLTHKDAILQGLAAISLAQTKDDKSYDLISEALHKNKSMSADGLMLLALSLTGDEKAKVDLRKVLENKKSRNLLKAAAAIGLGLLKDSESVPTIVKMLYTKEGLYNVVLAPYLILSLGMIQDQKGVEVLQKLWDNIEKDSALWSYHTNLAVALTMLGKREEIVLPKLLTEHLKSTQKNILLRSYALHTLGLVGNKESVLAFVEAYKDDNTYVRFETMAGLGFLLDGSKINPLNKITENNIDIPTIIMNHIMLIPIW
ncbi:MAG: HEAT repeat domain-containing protein [Planctomycetota bacterium]